FADVVDERFLVELSLKQFKSLPQPKMNDGVERFTLDLLARKTGIIFQEDGFAGSRIAEGHAAFFDLQFLRARHRDAQAHGDVVRDVIADNTENPALLHRAVRVEDVIGRAAADIDDEGTEAFLVLRK